MKQKSPVVAVPRCAWPSQGVQWRGVSCPPARFVTKAELGKLGLGHLVGTPLLRAFMHGYFLHNRLHAKARALAEPFAYEAYRAQRVAAKLDSERQSRIGLVRKLPKVPPSVPGLVAGPAPYFATSLCPFKFRPSNRTDSEGTTDDERAEVCPPSEFTARVLEQLCSCLWGVCLLLLVGRQQNQHVAVVPKRCALAAKPWAGAPCRSTPAWRPG